MANETLGVLRARLRARLGFSAAGAAAGINQTLLNDFLQGSQTLLYWMVEWARLRRYENKSIGVGQTLIDYPLTANRDRILRISILDPDTGQYSPPIKKGISPEMYTTVGNRTRPYRWEPYEQIELYPQADKAYEARIWFIRDFVNQFTEDGHATTIDSELVFIHALGDAKEHYRQPDWKRYADARDALVLKLKGKNWGKDVFSPYDYIEEEQIPKPVVV